MTTETLEIGTFKMDLGNYRDSRTLGSIAFESRANLIRSIIDLEVAMRPNFVGQDFNEVHRLLQVFNDEAEKFIQPIREQLEDHYHHQSESPD